MKPTMATLAAIIALSLAFWLGYYTTSGGAPPSAEVTSILVGISLGLVFLAKWLWKFIQKNRGGTE